MDASSLDQVRDTLALLAVTLRYAVNLGVFAFAYWQVAH